MFGYTCQCNSRIVSLTHRVSFISILSQIIDFATKMKIILGALFPSILSKIKQYTLLQKTACIFEAVIIVTLK